MKPRVRSIIFVTCLVSAFACGFVLRGVKEESKADIVPSVQAQSGNGFGARRCSSRTLKGAYGIKFEGLSLAGGPFASVSRITFDGEGQFTTSEIGSFNGHPLRRTFTGPYTVNADCTGFLDFSSSLSDPPHEAHGEFVIVDGGREFFVLDNEEGWVANGVGKQL